MAAVREAIEKCGRHLSVSEDGRPFAEAQIGRDDNTGSLIEPAEHVEEECTAGRTARSSMGSPAR